MINFFKPEDFNNIYKQVMKQGYLSRNAGDMWEPNYRQEDIAKEVNEMLNALIEAMPVVYGSKFISNDGASFDIGSIWNTSRLNDKTHKARLAFIEPISCIHVPKQVLGTENAMWAECANCGVELKALWSAK